VFNRKHRKNTDNAKIKRSNDMTLMTVRQFAEKHPWPSESALRALIYHEKIQEAIIRSGRRILIDEAKFFDLLKKNQTSEVTNG